MKPTSKQLAPQQLAQIWLDAKQPRKVPMVGGARYIPGHQLAPEVEALISAAQGLNKGCSLRHACLIAAQRFQRGQSS